MVWPLIYAFIKYWLPIISVLGLFVKLALSTRKAIRAAKDDISSWANVLLDNHMTHIQDAVESASKSLTSISETNKELVASMKSIREDSLHSQTELMRVQNTILTGIEVLKDRG